ncbi:MAG TPA: 2-dehydropantoate 2-reductase N-terminal domain-containing protein [Thermoplasmata archaeon]|nr:2-dehydropantoate 2-reductase N-terminal domain-containing protein [Thermoplasmata archaeon]
MKVLVFGAGVIGTMHAWAFERAGHTVSLLVRPGHQDRWANGVALRILDGRGGRAQETKVLYRPNIVTAFGPDDGYDLIVDAVRYTQAESVLPELAANRGKALILFFHQSWRGLDLIDRTLTKEEYVLGMPRAGGVMADGVLDGAFEGKVNLGTSTCGRPTTPVVEGAARKNLDFVAGLFRPAGFGVETPDNMEHWHWVHFASTAVYTGAIAREGGYEAFATSKTAIRDALLAGREAMAICEARGADLRKIADAKVFATAPLVAAPLMRRALAQPITRRMSQTGPEHASEFRQIYDEVLETARQLSVPTPRLEAYGSYVDV